MGNKTSARDYDSQEIDNLEHDPDLHLKKTMPYGWTGSDAIALLVNPAGGLSEFEATSVNIAVAGAVKTITETNGVLTRTTVIDATDPADKDITITWS